MISGIGVDRFTKLEYNKNEITARRRQVQGETRESAEALRREGGL